MTDKVPLKRGTPEYRQHMKTIGSKGGRTTQALHPDHFKQIGSMGGRASRSAKSKPPAPQVIVVPEQAPVPIDKIADDIDAFFAGLGND